MTSDSSFDTPEQHECDYLIPHLREAHSILDYKTLSNLAENARGKGIFYGDVEEKHVTLFKLMLNISLDLLQQPEAFLSADIWSFIATCYDIHFHQIQLNEYPADTGGLFFELTRNVLQPAFYKLYTEAGSVQHWYNTCIYFIKMADGWFSTRKREFIDIYTLLQPWMNHQDTDLNEYWSDIYKDLTSQY